MDAFAVTPAPAHAKSGPFDNDRKLRLGMLFYVLTDVTFVVFLLVSYVWLRAYNTDGGWFPFKGMRTPDQGTSLILLVLIVLSAVSFYAASRGIRAGNQTVLSAGAAIALILLVVTLIGQIRFMGQQQFATQDGTFASTWIMLGVYHIYHMLVGLILGIGITVRAFRGFYTRERHVGLVTVGYFWYWMALMPVIVFLMTLLLPAKI